MKVQTAFRFDKELLDMVREKAAAEKRSLNNYIEYLLYKEVGDIPNETTHQAIEDARVSKGLKPIEDVDQFLEDL
ncbi:MAG: hypothetical protein RIC80_14450 [Cyclobacteriaceae bacterium]